MQGYLSKKKSSKMSMCSKSWTLSWNRKKKLETGNLEIDDLWVESISLIMLSSLAFLLYPTTYDPGTHCILFHVCHSCFFCIFCRWSLPQQNLWSSTWGSSLWKTRRLTWPTCTTTCPPPHLWSSFSAQGLIPWGPSSALPKREAISTGKIRGCGCY